MIMFYYHLLLAVTLPMPALAELPIEQITVVGQTPLSQGKTEDYVLGNVQYIDSSQLVKSQAVSLADPPFEQVVAKTIGFTLDYREDDSFYSATLFSTKSNDDIIFQQAGGKPSQGYFINVDETRRRGVELIATTRIDDFSLTASYNDLKATFESDFTSFSPVNPKGPNRQVEAGDTIPSQPQHQFKLNLDWQASQNFNVGGEILHASSQYFLGDEANENKQLSSYWLANIYLSYQITPRLNLSAKVDNIFDRQYETFGAYAEADEVLGGIYPQVDSVYFVGPARPRSLSVNVNISY